MPLKSFLETEYGLRFNPFPGKATYGEDKQLVYVPEMFGPQRPEFLRKFVVAPLEDGQPVLGAVWSVVEGDPESRGFGKSTLMGEEAKRINQDFGFATLRELGVSEAEALANPILAGYVSFNSKAAGGISSMDAAAFNLVRFLLRSTDSKGVSIHSKLFERAAARLVSQGRCPPGSEREAIVSATKERFRKLAVSIDIRNLLEDYLFHLASPDTDALERFLASEVGTWHHDRNGLKYLQIFVVFAEFAGIEHVTFFIDQVEDFTSSAGPAKIQKNVKIIRDALLETEPFASRASFVFQLHPAAWDKLQLAWRHEDLRSLDPDEPLNKSVTIVLTGLESFAAAKQVVESFLNHKDVVISKRAGLKPFTEASLRLVWDATKPRPRNFLRVVHGLLQLGKDARRPVLDEGFVKPKLAAIVSRASDEGAADGDDERLA